MREMTPKEIEKELKPCPLCKARVTVPSLQIEGDISGTTITRTKIKCPGCGLELFHEQISVYGRDKITVLDMSAVERWNTRKPIDDMVEQLEEFMEEAEQLGVVGMVTDMIEIARNGGQDVETD